MNKTASFTIIVSVFLILFQAEVIVNKVLAVEEKTVMVVPVFQNPPVTSTTGIAIENQTPTPGGADGNSIKINQPIITDPKYILQIPELSTSSESIQDFCNRFNIKV